MSAQNISTGGMNPKSMKKRPVDATKVQPFTSGMVLQAHPTLPLASTPLSSLATGNASTTTGTGGTLFGIQSVPTFNGAFAPENGAFIGDIFPFIMMGKDPLAGGTTTIPARITEISLQLLNADGSTFMNVPFSTTFDDIMTDSPNFA